MKTLSPDQAVAPQDFAHDGRSLTALDLYFIPALSIATARIFDQWWACFAMSSCAMGNVTGWSPSANFLPSIASVRRRNEGLLPFGSRTPKS